MSRNAGGERLIYAVRRQKGRYEVSELATSEYLALSLSILGVIFWAASPAIEVLLGDRGVLGSLGVGFVLLATAAYMTFQAIDQPYSVLPRVILAWGALCYLNFRFTPPIKLKPKSRDFSNCTPELLAGDHLATPIAKSKFRLRLWANFEVDPQPCELAICAAAEGRAFYGLFWTRSSNVLTPSVGICCLNIDDSCRGHYLPRGTVRSDETPLSLMVRNECKVDTDLITIRTSVYANVGTSGGGIGASAPGVGGASVSLTKSDLGVEVDMGTFVWKCRRGEQESANPAAEADGVAAA